MRSALAFGLLLGAQPSLAQVAYDNFTEEDTFFRIGWSVIGGSPTQSLSISQGEQFVSTATGPVGRLTVAMGHTDGSNAVLFRLYGDEAGTLGDQIGEPVYCRTEPSSLGLPAARTKIGVSGSDWFVREGGRYWLVAEGDLESSHAWQLNLVGDSGRHYALDSRSGGPEYSTVQHGTFRLDLVPEPGTWLGLVGLAILLRRRKR